MGEQGKDSGSTGSPRTENEGDPSTSSGRAEVGDEPAVRIQRNRNRPLQIARTGRRKLFNKERRKIFLEWFGATCNMGWAAEKAGVNYKTVSRHILKDSDFAAEVREVMGLAVLRMKAKSLETKKEEAKPGGAAGDCGDDDEEDFVPDLDVDREQAMRLVREHERTLVLGRKQGRTPRIASNEEVRAEVGKRLRIFQRRVRKWGCVLRDGPSAGSVPPQDERGQ